jgi:hypothetical protein
MSKNRRQAPSRKFEDDAKQQYERCMVDSPEMIEYKQKSDLSVDEIAELKCKPFACRIQMCMSLPRGDSGIHRDVMTGDIYRFDDPCTSAHSDFMNCVEREKAAYLSSLGNYSS